MNTIDGREIKYKGILNAKFNPLGVCGGSTQHVVYCCLNWQQSGSGTVGNAIRSGRITVGVADMLGAICGSAISMDLPAQSVDP